MDIDDFPWLVIVQRLDTGEPVVSAGFMLEVSARTHANNIVDCVPEAVVTILEI